MTLSLSKLQKCAEKAVSKRRPSIATIESLAFHQALYPDDVLALIRVARAAKRVTKACGMDCAANHELTEAVNEISE